MRNKGRGGQRPRPHAEASAPSAFFSKEGSGTGTKPILTASFGKSSKGAFKMDRGLLPTAVEVLHHDAVARAGMKAWQGTLMRDANAGR